MRILELEITDVRGIKHVHLKPNGKNLVIWGPNGSGKSAVVDAVDFLLTGRISRLTGEGTKGITLKEYGPHIDNQLSSDAVVRAVVNIPGNKKAVEVIRRMSNPKLLECDTATESLLQPIMQLAEQGQHVLTRREILRYITAESGTRAERIQDLLNITQVEVIRKTLVKVKNDFNKEHESAKRAVEKAEGAINSTVQQARFTTESALQVINECREKLSGKPIADIRSTSLKAGLRPVAVRQDSRAANISLIEKDIINLRNVVFEDNQEKIAQYDKELRELIAKVQSDTDLLRTLAQASLIRLGLTLVDDKTENCPLCESPWPAGKLRKHLEKRSSMAGIAAQYIARGDQLRSNLSVPINTLIASLEKVIPVTSKESSLKSDLAVLQSWLEELRQFLDTLESVFEKYPSSNHSPEVIKRLLSPAKLPEILDRVLSTLKTKSPEPTSEQLAWDMLTRLEENIKALEIAQHDAVNTELSLRRSVTMLNSFENARDEVLGALYDSIRDRFVELYRSVHKIDEGEFSAEFQPDGAGLEFEVDFYGRGKHPPHALHSEGHQDSMGLCLYLALAERLTSGLIDLVILDDVMMSVDSDHRREVCSVLGTAFPNRQFLITTHDKTWANQLRSEGIVERGASIEFRNWHVDTGPQVGFETDIWERIESDLARENVPDAAGTLRRGSEAFFGAVCDFLHAPVPYKISGQYELGDFVKSAMSRYMKLLKCAKQAANSWGDTELVAQLEEIRSTASQIYKRTDAEQWTVNTNVHYNEWASFVKEDFRPIVDAFQDLFGIFTCSNSECGTLIKITMTENTEASVRCRCGKVNWNLLEK